MLITTTEFAAQVGVSQRAVAKAIRVGRVPCYDETGAQAVLGVAKRVFVKADEAASAFRLSRARVDDAALAEMAEQLDRELSIEPEAAPQPVEAPGKAQTLVGAKTTKEELQADLLRLRLARERGELISRQAQLDAFETAGRVVGRQFQGMTAWAEELHGVSRTGGVPALAAWLRSKANDLCATLADALTQSAATEPDDSDAGDD